MQTASTPCTILGGTCPPLCLPLPGGVHSNRELPLLPLPAPWTSCPRLRPAPCPRHALLWLGLGSTMPPASALAPAPSRNVGASICPPPHAFSSPPQTYLHCAWTCSLLGYTAAFCQPPGHLHACGWLCICTLCCLLLVLRALICRRPLDQCPAGP